MRVVAVLAVLLVGFAGCVESGPAVKGSGDEPTVPTVPVDESKPTGILEGVVTDEEGVPVANVSLTLVGLKVSANTTAAGLYRFGKVNAGDYFLVAVRAGYHKAQVGAHVVADEVNRVDVTLRAVPVPVPRVESLDFRIYLSCRVLVSHPLGTMDLNNKGACVQDQSGTSNASRWYTYPTGMGLVGVLVEGKWQPTLSTSNVLKLAIAGHYTTGGYSALARDWEVSGRSPVALPVTLESMRAWAAGSETRMRYDQRPSNMTVNLEVVPSVTGQAVDVGAAVNQLVDVSVALVYVTEPADLLALRQFT
jgi:hypothetical protein